MHPSRCIDVRLIAAQRLGLSGPGRYEQSTDVSMFDVCSIMFSILSPTRTWFRLRDTTANRSLKSGAINRIQVATAGLTLITVIRRLMTSGDGMRHRRMGIAASTTGHSRATGGIVKTCG